MPRKGIMLCAPLELARLEKWLAQDGYVIWQTKFNGDRLRALLTDSAPTLLSSEETNWNFSLPHIADQIKFIQSILAKHGLFELDGEAYRHGWEHEEIHSVCSRTANLHPAHGEITYQVFDHIISGVPQHQRLDELHNREVQEAFKACPNLMLVPSLKLKSVQEVMVFYKVAIAQDYEGMVVRKANGKYKALSRAFMQKFKPSKKDEYTIVAPLQEHDKFGEPKPMVGSFLCRDEEGTEFSVSAGMTDREKTEFYAMWDQLPGKRIIVHYQATTKYGKPKFVTDLEVL